MHIKLYLELCFLTVVTVSAKEKIDSTVRVVIDNDAGADDAMALFLALLYEKHYNGSNIIGITTVHGNVYEHQSCINNQRILKIAQRQEVPIYRGAKEALVHTIAPDDYFGVDGLGDTNETLTGLIPEKDTLAAITLIELSKTYEGQLVIITLGPVTNIALAIKLDPAFLGRLKQLYVGATHLHSDVYPHPEYNVLMDVEAYKVVLEKASPERVTVLPYSQTKTFLDISKEWRNEVLGGITSDIIKALNKFEKLYIEKNPKWFPLDPALVACALKEDLIKEIKYTKQSIATCGNSRGIATNEFVDVTDANVRLIYSIDKDAYKEFLMEVFTN